jgi:hypothetical protein
MAGSKQSRRIRLASRLALALFKIPFANTQATNSIPSTPEFKVLQACAQNCLDGIDGFAIFGVAHALGCGSGGVVYDACYCNPQNFPAASSFISTCVVTDCPGTQAVTSAIAAYTEYCNTFNQAQATTTNEARATATTNTNPNSYSSTSTNTNDNNNSNNNGGNTQTATANSNKDGAQKSSSVIGIAVGVPLGVIGLFAIIL